MKKSFGKITVDEIKDSIKGDRKQAQIRQVVTTSYPSGKVGNSMSDSLFSEEEFQFESQDFEENRVAWIDVPKTATKEQVEALLAANPKACIYKVLSSEPILTEEQKSAIAAGLTTLDIIKERQIVRYGENHEKAGETILWKDGKVQYKSNFFSKTTKEDVDTRTVAVVPAAIIAASANAADVAIA